MNNTEIIKDTINSFTDASIQVPEIPFKKKESGISIVEYAQTEMRTFGQLPFGPVDSLVLSQLTYMHLGVIVPGVESEKESVRIADLYKAEFFDAMLYDVRDPKSNRSLLYAVCCSPRYRDIKINYYTASLDEETEKQFCAMTFILPDSTAYVAYRGTDATLIGWKEDFNMFFSSVIPGQISAVNYLETVANRLSGHMYVGGHSKGGNLALYGATFACQEIQERIIAVFNHDGPGLSPAILEMEGYRDLGDKIQTTVPKASVFGLIFGNGEHDVVKSDRMGIMQHDPFSWEILGEDFIYAEKLNSGTDKLIFTIYDLMKNLSTEDRQVFIDTVFDVLAAPGATSFTDWPVMAIKEFDTMVSTLKNTDEETKEKMKTVLVEFVKAFARNLFNLPNKDDILEFINGKIQGLNLSIINNEKEQM